MLHITTTTTQYLLGDQTFDVVDLTSDYAGTKFNGRISRVRIERGPVTVHVVIEGSKLRKDGSVSRVDFQQLLSLAYDSVTWQKIWDQSPDEFKTGLTDADREAVIPS